MTEIPLTGKALARVAVAVSGAGRSLANLLRGDPAAQGFVIAGVIASRPDCNGAAIARSHGLPLFVGEFSGAVPSTAAQLALWLNDQTIDWIALAGFIKLFPVSEPWAQRVVNIHPALLPRFGGRGMYGAKVHAAVLAAGDAESGASVHFVNSRYDEGSIIAQMTVPVLPNDDAQRLAERVFAAECRLYPDVLRRLVAGLLPRPDGQIERVPSDAI